MKKNPKQSTKTLIKKENKTIKRVVLFGILLINLIVFYPSLKCGFAEWDDTVYVTENPNIALNSNNIKQSFTKGETHGVYAPLTALSFSMNYSQAKMNPRPYHFTNIILHLVMVLLVFLLIFSLSKNLLFTAIVTLFFSLHPAQVESVTYISGRRDLLFSLFAIASMLFYVTYKAKQKSLWLILSIGCFLLSLLSKTQALFLPLVLFAIDYYMGLKVITKKNIIEKIPYIILTIIFGIVAITVKQASANFRITDEILQMPYIDRVIYACYGFVMYFYQLFIPNRLSLIHPYPETIPIIGYVCILGVLGLLYLMYWLYKHNQKTILFGLLFFSINLALMLQLFPNSYGLINDHYLYMPIIGIGILVAHLATNIHKKYQKTTLGIIAVFLIVMAISTVSRIEVFTNPITVNSDVIEKYPNSYVAHNNRGTAYFNQGDYNRALEDFNQSIIINPNSAYSLNNRATINISIGKLELALVDLNKAISIKPDYADAFSNRAIAKTFKRDSTILNDHNRAIELQPKNAKYYYNRGTYFLINGQKNIGCNDLQTARKLGLKQGNPRVDAMCP